MKSTTGLKTTKILKKIAPQNSKDVIIIAGAETPLKTKTELSQHLGL